MPFKLEIDAARGIALATFTGVCTPHTSREALVELWNAPEWDGRAVVWDARSARIEASPDDVQPLARYILDHQPETPPLRVAFVMGDDLSFGTVRMLEVYREDPRTETRVLRDLEEALAWAAQAPPAPTADG